MNVAAGVDEIVRDIREQTTVLLTRLRRLRSPHFMGMRPGTKSRTAGPARQV
ncbi:hypothetical protein ACH4L7_30765 [Streptomyces anulatus]